MGIEIQMIPHSVDVQNKQLFLSVISSVIIIYHFSAFAIIIVKSRTVTQAFKKRNKEYSNSMKFSHL